MKKTVICTVALILVSASSFASGLLVRGTYFTPSDSNFNSIYGPGWFYGGEIGIKVLGGLEIFLEGGYFTAKGKLSYTQEGTTLTLIPVGAGAKYYFLDGKLRPYVVAGGRYYMYQESNLLGTIKKNGPGFLGRAGLSFEFIKNFGLDVGAGYSWCEITTPDFTISLGGFELSAGVFLRI